MYTIWCLFSPVIFIVQSENSRMAELHSLTALVLSFKPMGRGRHLKQAYLSGTGFTALPAEQLPPKIEDPAIN
jgi:hypothetical protein